MFWILCEGNGALAVSVDDVLIAGIIAELLEETVDPDLFFESVEDCHVLRFCTGEGDGALLL